MATTVHEPPRMPETIDDQRERLRPAGGSGNGGGLASSGHDMRRVRDYSPPPSATGMWVVLASIAMTFAALTSALIVRKGDARDWHHLTLPSLLYWNTLVLIASSVTLEVARKRVAAFMRGAREIQPMRWLSGTLVLGLAFVAGQYLAWTQLRAQGLFLATNPNSSFFYVLTAIHAIHVTGGLGGLVRVMAKVRNSTLRKSTLDATSHYWHFMDLLWVYLLALLWMKL